MTLKMLWILWKMHLVMGSSDSSPTCKRLISFVDNKPIHYTNQCTTTAELRMRSAVFCFPFCSLPPRCFLPFTQRIPPFPSFRWVILQLIAQRILLSFISLGHSPVRHPTNSSFLAFRWVILQFCTQRIPPFPSFRWVILQLIAQRILLSFISLGHSPVRHPTNSSFLAFRWVILQFCTQRIPPFPSFRWVILQLCTQRIPLFLHFVGSSSSSVPNEFYFSFISLGHPPTHCPTNSTFSFISLGHPSAQCPTNSTFPSLRWSPFLSASTAFQQAILRLPAPPKSHRLHGLR